MALGFLKNQFKFCCSYFFSFFSFLVFCCCGVGQLLRRFLFLPASARTFFLSRFHFIPQSKVDLFFVVACWLTVDSLLFSIATFKIIPRFAVLAFFVAVLV